MKRNIGLARKELPNADLYLTFTIDEESQTRLNIKFTPALLLRKNENISELIPYDELLDMSGTQIPFDTQVKIRNFLE